VNTRPRPRLFLEADLLQFSPSSRLGHFPFEFLVPFAKLSHFSQTTFDPADQIIPVRLCRMQFILVMFSDLGSSLRHFGFEARPYLLVLVIVPVLKQAEGFFSTELCYPCEVLDTKPIQYLGSLQVARAQAQGALNRFGRHWRSRGHCPRRRHRSVPSPRNIRTGWKKRLVLHGNLR
jgi:hypothetical protein